MYKKWTYFLIGVGICFMICCPILILMAPIKLQVGFILIHLFFIVDCLYFLAVGGVLVVVGWSINKEKSFSDSQILFACYLIIFSTVFFICTFIFNNLAAPVVALAPHRVARSSALAAVR